MGKRKKYKCKSCGRLFDKPVIWIGSEDRRTIDRIKGCPYCDRRNVVLNVKTDG